MSAYQPPFKLSHAILSKVAEIAEWLGRWKQANRAGLVPHLRRGNRIRTIQASLAIEQNSLSLEQVTAVLDGKPVLGPPREIQEVRNAFDAYEALPAWDPSRIDDLLAAHGLLLQGLTADAGRLRQGGVGIYRGEQSVHMAPPPSQVPRLLEDLLGWLSTTSAHPLIASSAVHYELEFIHPFSDGNGRIGRLWQTLILSRWQPILAYLPVETVIKGRQDTYYRVLGEADAAADCSNFVLFMLDALATALRDAIDTETSVESSVKTSATTSVKTMEALLKLLDQNPEMTLLEVAAAIGRSVRAVEMASAKLVKAGKLRHVGPRKGGRWEVRR